ncbi:hypothetical protein RJ641_010465 [Dillenia turbinata]|uniref:HTH myb-type domain-containing protein n=1 Tax=Dillenia turbinata TaxID=194707 RepID=A0AAN8UYD9_9MAGN
MVRKSCRLRWFNQLNPEINKNPFTEEEEERLLAAHALHDRSYDTIGNDPNSSHNYRNIQFSGANEYQSHEMMMRSGLVRSGGDHSGTLPNLLRPSPSNPVDDLLKHKGPLIDFLGPSKLEVSESIKNKNGVSFIDFLGVGN